MTTTEKNAEIARWMGHEIKHNVADWSNFDHLSLTEHWNNKANNYVQIAKGSGEPWYKVKHRGQFYQLYTDFTFAKLDESEIKFICTIDGACYEIDELKYHSDWNWLMDCVSKIESLGFIFSIKEQSSAIRDKKTREYLQIRLNGEDSSKIESVYNNCFQFIQWYNQQKQ